MPLRPRDAEGNLDEWNAIERAVLERRSVRNFKDEPVPDHFIRRVLEAGRFAPSAGNCQPWQFIVITDRALIAEMDELVWATVNGMHGMYKNDDLIPNMAPMAEGTPGLFDPRIALGGMGAIVRKHLPASLNAPCVILLAADSRAISGPQLNIGICGQNMNLVANSLGIKACWNGFLVTGVPARLARIQARRDGGARVQARDVASRGLGRGRDRRVGAGSSPRERTEAADARGAAFEPVAVSRRVGRFEGKGGVPRGFARGSMRPARSVCDGCPTGSLPSWRRRGSEARFETVTIHIRMALRRRHHGRQGIRCGDRWRREQGVASCHVSHQVRWHERRAAVPRKSFPLRVSWETPTRT
jgi:nitroreductase